MRRLRLQDQNGKHVAEFDVPYFDTAPKAVRWGARAFALHLPPEVTTQPGVPSYRECLFLDLTDGQRVDAPAVEHKPGEEDGA